MKASEIIDSYVHDTVRHLPRAKRSDVAMELRALLTEELDAMGEAEGRSPDQTMAMELLKGVGRPADVAARYHHRPPIIAPADTRHFLLWALTGAVVVIVAELASPAETVDRTAFLDWLGLLVLVFGVLGWWRRRNPDAFAWRSRRVSDPRAANRAGEALAAAACLIPLAMYASPQGFAATVFPFAPVGGLALSDTLQGAPQYYAMLAALALRPFPHLIAAIEGRWRGWTRWASIALLMLIGLQMIWHAGLAGQNAVFVSAQANSVAEPILAIVGALTVLGVVYEIYREWMRTPAAAPSAA